MLNGKTVLITGGTGSFGKKFLEMIFSKFNPQKVIIYSRDEFKQSVMMNEYSKKIDMSKVRFFIGDVRDKDRLYRAFAGVDYVIHAAAMKQVPTCEYNPFEAIKTNIHGAQNVIDAALDCGVKKVVALSTDKAVNPTNIMGASKRLCEMIIQSFDRKIKEGRAGEIPQLFTHEGTEDADKDGTGIVYKNIRTEFVAVRFGNVLGSNGSVIPIFKRQIESGGPVTVTHPDIIRYFMTIPEAVSLVMLAGTYAHGGEIFVLDMGSPVKIVDLARNMIRLSGYKPDVDIKIEYTGLRPGEKLYEEKLMSEEGLKKTDNNMIHIGCPIPFDEDAFMVQLDKLMQYAYSNRSDIRKYVEEMVSTYHPA